MSSRSSGPAKHPAAVALCLILACAAVAVISAATAHAAQFKMVTCAGDTGPAPYITATNTGSPQNPGGIFDFGNYCGGQGGDPPGQSAFLRINENQGAGNAGQGAYGQMIFGTPSYVHFKAAGAYTRQPNAFNDGWRVRFAAIDFSNNWTYLLTQGSGVPDSATQSGPSNIFGPHLWPFGSYMDFHHFIYELACVRPSGCDRANYNATDANAFVFILNDDSPSEVYFTSASSPLLQSAWTSGAHWMSWYVHDSGSGVRNERVWVDGEQRYLIDYQAMSQCDPTSSQTNGEFARSYRPCPSGPFDHSWTLDTTSLSDGTHSLSICSQDYGQHQGLNGTGGQTCDSRTIRTDNHAPGAPAGLHVISSNPARYLDRFDAQFSLPPDNGSPIAKVHYEVIDASGKVVVPERVFAGTNPTQIADIAGPAQAGDYYLRVWLEDSVGFRGPATTAPIPHDSTPPAAPQNISIASPQTTRTTQAFDVRWQNILDSGSPIDAVHYQVLNGAGATVVPTTTISGASPQAIENLNTPRERGDYTLRFWLSDTEGNVGASVKAPLAYDCVRSDVGGGLALSAGLGKRGKSSIVVPQKESATLTGKLLGSGGHVAAAPLCVFSRVITDQDRQFLGVAMTGQEGSYQFAIGAGPSRELSVVYRPDQRELTASAMLKTQVRPTFRLRGKVVKNKGFAIFTGAVPGPHNEKVVVVLQVKSGKGWRVFRRYRTRAGGRYVMRYLFTQTDTPTTYIMRAQVRGQSGYPFEEGNSRAIPVPVRP